MPPKKRGRPVEENPKNIRLDIRVTQGELKILDDYCERKGVKRPQGLRDGIKALENLYRKWCHRQRYLHHFTVCHPRKASRTNIIALSGSVLQAACGQNRKDRITEWERFWTHF